MLWIIESEVFAFSIGDLQIRSQFGEKFNASFEIDLDFDQPVEVGLGDVDDYIKMGLEREDIIDALTLDLVQLEDGSKSTVKIRSNNPLFFPSFNLVVWVTHNSGTLLENFLVTVDFQKSLALNVRGKKQKVPSKQLLKYKSEFVVSKEGAPRPPEKQQFVKDESGAKAERINLESQTADDKAPSEESIAPVPVKTEIMNRRRLSGVIWANPRPNPNLATVEIEKKGDVQGLEVSKDEYVLQKGERLFSVARKLKVGNYHPAQVAATIWLHNIDKFIFGNIHGVQEGVKLDLKKLEEHVSGIDIQAAGNILKNQAAEWKLAKNATPIEEEIATISEIPLPSEKLEHLDDLFTQVNGWQATWEKMDIERHLDYYQTLETENSVLSNKRQLLAR